MLGIYGHFKVFHFKSLHFMFIIIFNYVKYFAYYVLC